MLYTHALRREEGVLAHGGPLVVDTGRHTGRSAEDKFIVREPGSEDRIWWGKVNQPLDGGALRRAAREGRSRTSAAATSTSSTRSPAPIRSIGSGARRDAARLPRAVRADDVHHPEPTRSSTRSSRRRSSCMRLRSRPTRSRTARAVGHLHRAPPDARRRC